MNYKGRQYELTIYGTDSVKKILEKFYDKYNWEESKRHYTKEKIILKNGDTLLNNTEENLNKTAAELEFEDDDNLELIDSGKIIWG